MSSSTTTSHRGAPLPAPYRQPSVDVTSSAAAVDANDSSAPLSPTMTSTASRTFSRPTRSGTGDTGRSSTRGGGPHGRRSLKRVLTSLFTPDKKINHPAIPGTMQSIRNVVLSSWLNVLLVFIPVSWALHFAIPDNSVAVFVTSFIAIIPLAALLGYTTETLAMFTSQTIGGLLNATLGNAVELIVAILALVKCELQVVQSSLIGSILSNLLLVCGMCFFAGGTRFAEQEFKATASQLNSSLLLMAVIAVLIPSAFHFSITTSTTGDGLALTTDQEKYDLLAMSHGVAVLLLVLYLGYLLFQLFTHADLYADSTGPTGSTRYPENVANYPHTLAARIPMTKAYKEKRAADAESQGSAGSAASAGGGDTTAGAATSTAVMSDDVAVRRRGTKTATAAGDVEQGQREMEEEEEEEEEETPQMNWPVCLGSMVLVTVLVGVTAEWLVDSINGLVASTPALSTEWVGLILLPIIGNAAEHYTAVTVSVKDKLDLSISVAVGSSIQIALFVIPLTVVLGWIIGKPLLMLFDPFESVVLFLSVILVNQTLQDGKTNWMEGLVLFVVYIMIAVTFWYYPGSDTANLVGQAGCS